MLRQPQHEQEQQPRRRQHQRRKAPLVFLLCHILAACTVLAGYRVYVLEQKMARLEEKLAWKRQTLERATDATIKIRASVNYLDKYAQLIRDRPEAAEELGEVQVGHDSLPPGIDSALFHLYMETSSLEQTMVRMNLDALNDPERGDVLPPSSRSSPERAKSGRPGTQPQP